MNDKCKVLSKKRFCSFNILVRKKSNHGINKLFQEATFDSQYTKSNFDFMSGIQNCMLSVHINIWALHLNEFIDYQVCPLELAETRGWALVE